MREDLVLEKAKEILKLINEDDVVSGTNQFTTFNSLREDLLEKSKRWDPTSFKGVTKKPDGWYLPLLKIKPAIILETKKSDNNLGNEEIKELMEYCEITLKEYSNVIGILYNGDTARIYKSNNLKMEEFEYESSLKNKEYYLSLFNQSKIDKNYIYEVTQKINNGLHFKFGMTDLQDRMIFTACALVAQRYNPVNGLDRLKDMGYNAFKNWIFDALSKSIEANKKQNSKLDVLLEEYAAVRMSITEDQIAINNFIDNVCEIADLVNSDNWNGEDVMAIFFNEFSRYKGKSDAGQVFTPDHITSFMYRLISVNMNDKVLDATCGSGAFLVKAMSNMIKEAGGVQTDKAKIIKSEQLFGIEMYRKIFALACANMLIHKDGKTNLAQMDAQTNEASNWIKSKNITKVLMNPPYERKYGCMKIVKNVLDNVPTGTKCAFILPDKKLEKDGGKKLLKTHTLTHIVKLPENLFFGVGVTTSIFIFETGIAQGTRNIKGYHIKEDGLETVKNKGRQDIKNKWQSLEDYWVKAIQDDNDDRYDTKQLIDPDKNLSYQMPEKPFEIYEEDFMKTMMDYEMFKRGIDVKDFNSNLMQKVLYGSDVSETEGGVSLLLKDGE